VTSVIISKSAARDLYDQALNIYQQSWNKILADTFLDEMYAYIFDILAHCPRIGRATPEYGANMRKLIYKRYTIIYHISASRVEVLTVHRKNLPRL